MADINSLFGGGGQTLNTNGGIAGLGGGGGDADFFKAMAMRKMQQDAEDRQRRQEREDYAFAQAKQAAQNANRPPELSPADQHMKDMRDRDEVLQMQARQRPPMAKEAPTDWTGLSGGSGPGHMMADPHTMNAYQRQAYLPGNSTADPVADAKAKSIDEDTEMKKWQQDQAERAQRAAAAAGKV